MIAALAPTGLTGATTVGIVLFDLLIILLMARLCAAAAQKVGQPRVVGEIVAGIVLGPSLWGWQLSSIPRAMSFLHCDASSAFIGTPKTAAGETVMSVSQCVFPQQSKAVLNVIGALALLLFMFLVGLDFKPESIRGNERGVAAVSLLVIALPVVAGFALQSVFFHPSFVAHPVGGTAPGSLAFNLFIGAMLSVTAFPVMARILQEKKLDQSRMGSIGIASAAVVTVLMFLLVNTASILAKGQSGGAVAVSWLWGALYLAVMLLPVRRLLLPLGRRLEADPTAPLPQSTFVWLLIVTFASGFFADLVGINVIVGGFVAGIVMPARAVLAEKMKQRLGDIVIAVLLPVFLAYSGLNTDFRVLDASTIVPLLVLLVAAIVTKVLGSMLGARMGSLTWQEGATLGALMNCRGLLVLVVALAGVQANVIGPKMQIGGVLMALVTTMMTGPLFDTLNRPPSPALEGT